MEVCSSAMGPERILPRSDDELGEEEHPGDGALLPVGAVWSVGEEATEEEEDGEEMELDGEEEEHEEANSGGYYYQPLNQDPDGMNGTERPEDEERGEAASHAQQVQQVQQRIECFYCSVHPTKILMCLHKVMGLHLPEAPHHDSDDEEDPEGAAALRSRASIPMDADHVELVKRTMAAVALPSLSVPPWAREISDDQWTDMVQRTLQSRQSASTLRLSRKNINGP